MTTMENLEPAAPAARVDWKALLGQFGPMLGLLLVFGLFAFIGPDPAAYGCILIQGHGQFGTYAASAAIMLRYGQWSSDEYFVSEDAARRGVTITNHNPHEPLVMLKHFGPNHTEMPRTVPAIH